MKRVVIELCLNCEKKRNTFLVGKDLISTDE